MTISEQVVKAMPERIYAAKKTEGSNCVVSFDTPSLDYNVEYVRADLVLFHPVQGVKVKTLGEDDYEVIIDAAAKAMRKATSGVRGQAITVHDCLDWWVMKATENHIISALEPSAARELALEEAARNAAMYLATGFITCPRCGEDVETKNTDAEYALRAALSSPDHADAVRERAWYFSAGDTVPEWLEKIEKGNCTLTFGVDVVVTSKDGGYEVRPQGIADNAGPILHVVNQGNVTPEIKGGGNGVAIIGYNSPYDETAGRRIARLKRLLEMARPYVECYDTREHNSEQDAVLTEIDKALSVVVCEPHADAGISATHPSGGDRHGE